jgi:nickel-dependent lactate racemase
VPNQIILPPLLAGLERAGLKREHITILVANGMHPPTTGQALKELVGREIMDGYRIVNHDCRAQSELKEVVRIAEWPIEINRLYLEADLKILTGLIEPHPFAGYSGGGKAILPGIASLDTMRFMHSFALLDQNGVAADSLAGNPFHTYVKQAAHKAGVDLVVNVLQDQRRNLSGLFAGGLDEVFAAGTAMAQKLMVVSPPGPADLVVTSAGGHPLDATMYQSSKGLITASQMVKPGGNIIWIAGCKKGLGGSEFVSMITGFSDYASFKDYYVNPDHFTIDQWGAQAFIKALEKPSQVWLYSPGLKYAEARQFGVKKVENLNGLFAGLASYSQSIQLLPQGPYLACKAV